MMTRNEIMEEITEVRKAITALRDEGAKLDEKMTEAVDRARKIEFKESATSKKRKSGQVISLGEDIDKNDFAVRYLSAWLNGLMNNLAIVRIFDSIDRMAAVMNEYAGKAIGDKRRKEMNEKIRAIAHEIDDNYVAYYSIQYGTGYLTITSTDAEYRCHAREKNFFRYQTTSDGQRQPLPEVTAEDIQKVKDGLAKDYIEDIEGELDGVCHELLDAAYKFGGQEFAPTTRYARII